MGADSIKPIVFLSGPVGAGKSTVAWELVAISPEPLSNIEGDIFWSFLVRNSEQTPSAKFRAIMASMTAAAIPLALAGHEVIVDFSIPPWFLETAKKVAARRNVPIDYVVLKPAETICAARAAKRPEGTITDYSPDRDLYKSFELAPGILDGDLSRDPAQIAAQIRVELDAGLFRLS